MAGKKLSRLLLEDWVRRWPASSLRPHSGWHGNDDQRGRLPRQRQPATRRGIRLPALRAGGSTASNMMRLKPEVNPSAMRPELLLAVVIACRIYDEYDYECIVTSLNDSAHSQTSLHYAGSAVDLRTRDIPAAHVDEIAHAIRASLTQDYDVLRETDHIHIEYQPRRRK